mmetsp:Transcript_12639/g.40858  ORF Transcript_12639/g.40858 Transcript_12639/m.40858 type:complete len:205 (+) Transcript_12639:1013-1627(+)
MCGAASSSRNSSGVGASNLAARWSGAILRSPRVTPIEMSRSSSRAAGYASRSSSHAASARDSSTGGVRRWLSPAGPRASRCNGSAPSSVASRASAVEAASRRRMASGSRASAAWCSGAYPIRSVAATAVGWQLSSSESVEGGRPWMTANASGAFSSASTSAVPSWNKLGWHGWMMARTTSSGAPCANARKSGCILSSRFSPSKK